MPTCPAEGGASFALSSCTFQALQLAAPNSTDLHCWAWRGMRGPAWVQAGAWGPWGPGPGASLREAFERSSSMRSPTPCGEAPCILPNSRALPSSLSSLFCTLGCLGGGGRSTPGSLGWSLWNPNMTPCTTYCTEATTRLGLPGLPSGNRKALHSRRSLWPSFATPRPRILHGDAAVEHRHEVLVGGLGRSCDGIHRPSRNPKPRQRLGLSRPIRRRLRLRLAPAG